MTRDRYPEHVSVNGHFGAERRDERCPVACGQCCEDLPDYTCLCITATGCALPRSARPLVCNDYLCSRGRRAVRVARDYGLRR